MTIQFGRKPVRAAFLMSTDSDFFQEVVTSDGTSYPVTASMVIKLLDADDVVIDTWSASFSTDTATFQEDKADVATVLADSPVQGRVFYEDGAGGPEQLVAQGPISDQSP